MISSASPPVSSSALTGVFLVAGGTALYSVNDMAIKSLSGGYALHQIVLFRALIGMALLLILVARSPLGFGQLRSRRPLAQISRAVLILISNSAYYLGLAAMPMADAAAVSYTSPLFITAFSVVFLQERVGPRRWSAVALGLLGTLLILRPGSGLIDAAALLVLLSAMLYASANLMARSMRETETAISLSFTTNCGFILLSLCMGLAFGDGSYAGQDPLWDFLLRPWIWPPLPDWPLLLLTGCSVMIGGLMVTEAYRTTEAGLLAPFDYTGMPMAIIWGVVIFGTWPDLTSWAGIILICGSGIFVVWREAALAKRGLR